MTFGKNSRKSTVRSSIRAPKFLDKSSGFYGRLDEPETSGERDEDGGKEVEKRWNGTEGGEGGVVSGPTPSVVHGVFDFNEGMMEDDGETLLRRKPSRRSSRWSRSSSRKQKEAKTEEDIPQDERPSLGTSTSIDTPVPEGPRMEVEVEIESLKKMQEGDGGRATEPALVHFAAREDADDKVLIRDKKRGREEEKEEEEEGEEERRMKREQEEGMKMVKRTTLKNYRKALDRALRRGWEAFITNLYSVTLAPVESPSSSSSPSSKKEHQQNVALAEFQEYGTRQGQ